MNMSTFRNGLLACVMTMALLGSASAFIYLLGPNDLASHFMCAVNATMSPKSIQKLANSIQIVSDATRNYTGNSEKLRGLLPDEIVNKMYDCESYHKMCYQDDSDERAGAESSDSPSDNFSPQASVNDTEPSIECEPNYYVPLVVQCYKEVDLLYFKGINFEEEADLTVQLFRNCLERLDLNDKRK
ncbi:uncharacterized protein LOC111266497 [Varroa jacobsoni]|uniref:uncharacterized protein LOC111266497 n=1 Tax=Varroa jacobsoni TaxID=62625 RepID=UPI000BF975A9|nr:uncharacterized protein LOC111266497 [Varroa jacobsoni]XP_022699764.1 uncharacterized protein LOC111266497 [Varroa jacobsoni]